MSKFETFEERDDVKEVMRTFTFVLAQMYEKKGLSIPVNKASDHLLEEFEIDNTVYDKEDLMRENEELRPKVDALKAEKKILMDQLKELKKNRLQK